MFGVLFVFASFFLNHNLIINRRNLIVLSSSLNLPKNNYSNFKPYNSEESDKTIIQTNKIDKINFLGSITDESCYYLMQSIENLKEENKCKKIKLILQSPGGSLLPAFGLVDYIKSSTIPIDTYINGYVASAASLISISGSERFMGKNGLMLIHSLRTSSDGGTYKNINDNKENADTFMELLKNIYLTSSNIDDDYLNFLLSHDLWLNSTTCLNYNLVDKLY
tara:strand:- start:261 stop:926 length:666 start_codon:yes stop_codon:yes gene_type:complete